MFHTTKNHSAYTTDKTLAPVVLPIQCIST